MRIAITAPRDLPPSGARQIREAMHKLCGRATGFILGGARGGDTAALLAAFDLFPERSRTVILPGRLTDAPVESRQAIERTQPRVIELGLPLDDPHSYWVRNEALLSGVHSDGLLAFTRLGSRGSAGTLKMGRKRQEKDPAYHVRHVPLQSV